MPSATTSAYIKSIQNNPERRQAMERIVNDATQASKEARQVSERLRKATRLYRERLTGRVEEE
jgi:hypothetical protein